MRTSGKGRVQSHTGSKVTRITHRAGAQLGGHAQYTPPGVAKVVKASENLGRGPDGAEIAIKAKATE